MGHIEALVGAEWEEQTMSSSASKYFPDEKILRSQKARVFHDKLHMSESPIWLILTETRVAGLKRFYWNPLFGLLPYVFKLIANGKFAFNIPLRELADVRQTDVKALVGSRHISYLLIKGSDGKENIMSRGMNSGLTHEEFILTWISDIHEAMDKRSPE